MRRVLIVVIALAAWFALVLQFVLTLRTATANGMSVGAAILTYFSFFTLLTNLLVAIVLTVPLISPNSRWGRLLASPFATTGTALCIATVGIVYSLVLRQIWDPKGLSKLADVLLHDAVPVLFVVFWIWFVPKSGLRWRDPWLWGIYPVVYFLLVLFRGTIYGVYPYPFVDVTALGYRRALLNAVALLAIFLVAGFVVVALGRRNRHTTAQ